MGTYDSPLDDGLNGQVMDYVFPIVAEGATAAGTLQDYARVDATAAREDIRALTREDVIAPTTQEEIRVLRAAGFSDAAGQVVPTRYTLGGRGEAYVAERDIDAIEPSLAYLYEEFLV